MPEDPQGKPNLSELINKAFDLKQLDSVGFDTQQDKIDLNKQGSIGVSSPYADITRIEGRSQDFDWYKYKDKYEKRFDQDLKVNIDPYEALAKDQSFFEASRRRMSNIIPNVALGIIETVGLLGELPGAIIGY